VTHQQVSPDRLTPTEALSPEQEGPNEMTNRNLTPNPTAGNAPTLHDYITGEELREATAEEHRASIRAARFDGGAGVIVLDDGRRCYVTDPCPATLPATGRSADAWWAWHDAGPSRWSPGEDPLEATADAERRCTAWLRGESTDGPDTISRTAPGEHYSYLPIDVGFDPRVCGISVELRERS